MQKGIKFRIYPNREQQNLINQTLGCCRLIYNKGLAFRNYAYENDSKIGYSKASPMLTELKNSEDFAFLKVVDSIALQQSLRDHSISVSHRGRSFLIYLSISLSGMEVML